MHVLTAHIIMSTIMLGRRSWSTLLSISRSLTNVFPVNLTCHSTSRYYHLNHWSRASSSVGSQNQPALELCSKGKKLKVGWSDGEESVFHSLWLRHNCRCPSCWDSSFEQKTIDGEVLQGHPTIKSAIVSELDGESVVNVCWSYEGDTQEHGGHFQSDWLKENSYSAEKVEQSHRDTKPLIATSLAKFSYKDIESSEEGMWRWLHHVSEYGFALVTDAPIIDQNVIKLAERVGLTFKNYYGELYEIKALENTNDISYSKHALPFHGDMCHFESPPGLQLLYCLQFDDCVEGGETVLVDLYSVACDMREKYPHHFEVLTRVPFNYLRHFGEGSNRVMMEFRKPPIVLNGRGEIIALRYHPQSEGPLLASQEDVEKFYEAFTCFWRMINSTTQFPHRLRPGEVLTYNNRRMVHGRRAMKTNGGMRHIQGCYVIIDEFKSKVRVLASKFAPPGYRVKNVFNTDSL